MNPATIFDCTEGRRQERLVQGVLRFLLTNDEPFRCAFCAWARFPAECTDVREDVLVDAHRHDLVLTFADGSQRIVGLGLWSDVTDHPAPGREPIDLFILPDRSGDGRVASAPAARTRAWESLVEGVVPRSQMAVSLLRGLAEYAWTGDVLPASALRDEIQAWWSDDDRDWRVSCFLRGCAERALELGLSVSTSQKLNRAAGTGYWGQYLKHGRLPASHRSWLWNGFVFRVDSRGRVEKVLFALQLLDQAADRLGRPHEGLPRWYPWEDGNTGIIIASDGAQKLSVRDWYETTRDVLEEYAGLQ